MNKSLIIIPLSVVAGLSFWGFLQEREEHEKPKIGADSGSSGIHHDVVYPSTAWRVVDSNYMSLFVEVLGQNNDSLWLDFVESIPAGGISPGISIAPGTSTEVSTSEFELSSSISISDFASLGTTEFFVMGNPIRRGGVVDESKTVIQQWSFAYADGWPVAKPDLSMTPWGTSTVESDWTFDVIGGVYIEPGSRQPFRRRQELLVELSGDVTCMEIDPDGRFLVYAELGTGLWQIDLTTPQVPVLPVLMLPVSTHSGLGAISHLQFKRVAGGAKTLIASSVTDGLLFIPDENNDGILDSVTSISGMAALQSGLLAPAVWETSYDKVTFP